ncbi:MAG: YcaO-like family protein [Desulfobacterales bacterium]
MSAVTVCALKQYKGMKPSSGISEVLNICPKKAVSITVLTAGHSLEFFKDQDIYEKVKMVEQNWQVKVGIIAPRKKLPVLGILFLDDTKGRYGFHLGADPNPITALERCFTEFFQGGRPVFHQLKPHENGGIRSAFWKRQFHFSLSSYSGRWPEKLLSSGSPGYSFNGFNSHLSISDGEDLKWLVQIIEALGLCVLARDSDFLGFLQGMSIYGHE